MCGKESGRMEVVNKGKSDKKGKLDNKKSGLKDGSWYNMESIVKRESGL